MWSASVRAVLTSTRCILACIFPLKSHLIDIFCHKCIDIYLVKSIYGGKVHLCQPGSSAHLHLPQVGYLYSRNTACWFHTFLNSWFIEGKQNIMRIHITGCGLRLISLSLCRSSMGTPTAPPPSRTCCALPSWPATSACCRWAGTPASPWGWSCSCAWTSAPEVSSGVLAPHSALWPHQAVGCQKKEH